MLAICSPATGAARNLKEVSVGARPNISFDAIRTASIGVTRLYKWLVVTGRHSAQQQLEARCGRNTCRSNWSNAVEQLRGEADTHLVEAANRFVNRAEYVADEPGYAGGDVWATPAELFSRGGDCEDFALAKFFLLRELGIANGRMRIAILGPTKLQESHAVLLVETETGMVVLDNLRPRPYRPDGALLARTIFAFNGHTWWIALPNRKLAASEDKARG
jgi:predicted transglutaminase-like cysteine proteinase